jgi:hypothetical protein
MAKRKLKLPKKIAGVKIPKSVRKGPVGQFLNSSAGQLLVAEALIAAGGAFFATETNDAGDHKGSARKLGRSGAGSADEARQLLERGSARLSFAFGEAVKAFRTALREGNPQQQQQPSVIEGEVSKKKSSSSPTGPDVGSQTGRHPH